MSVKHGIDRLNWIDRLGRMAHGRIRRSRSGILPCGLLTLCLTTAAAVAGETNQAFFAEPSSGRKVTQYEIELPVRRDERLLFSIPDDCGKLLQRVSIGATYRGGIMDRGLWRKTENDCRFHDFLTRHPQRVLEDHISDYDFRNARIEDLPLDRGCADSSLLADPAKCTTTATGEFGTLRFFPIPIRNAHVPAKDTYVPCVLRNGRFRGYIVADQDGIRCTSDANASGVRLIGVDYADINGDRILDAVLRFIPIGPGNNRIPLILPLTRTETSAPFIVPGPTMPTQSVD